MQTPASYRTKREVALDLMRNTIISGQLPPGTRLILEELSQQFGLSLTPIREALPVLEAERFISQLPHRGAIVAPMDKEEILELYATRSGMEAMVTRQAVHRLSDSDLEAMDELISHMDAIQGDWSLFLSADKEFHLVLYRAAGSHRWLNTIEKLWQRSTRYMLASTAMSGAVGAIQTDHGALLKACQDGDVERAAMTTVSHLQRSQDRLLHDWS